MRDNDDRVIGFLIETFDLFHNYTGKRPTRISLPLAMYHKLVKEIQQRRTDPLGDGLAAVFEFEGCQVRRCTPKGVYLNAAGQNEEVNEELRIS